MSKTKENVVDKAVYAFNRKVFCDGMRDGFPIALGYFAVSFSLGIAARKAGLCRAFLPACLTMHPQENTQHLH